MSAVSDEVSAEVPEEVAALDDSSADSTEAHNIDRPKGDNAAKAKKRTKKPSISELSEGQQITGKVKTVTPYGAFIDIGYASDGLLHISRMSDDFVSNVEDVVEVGQDISVRIVSIDLEKKQVALTARSEESEAKAEAEAQTRKENRKNRPKRSGGDRAAQQASCSALAAASFDEDKFVEGEVVSTLAFGAFVRFSTADVAEGLEGELDGLVHISVLSKDRCDSVESVVSVGQKVQVRVKSVDSENTKVSLSMISKADEPAPREQKQSNDGKRGPRLEERFSADAMGASDWKESMDKFNEGQSGFLNNVLIVNKK